MVIISACTDTIKKSSIRLRNKNWIHLSFKEQCRSPLHQVLDCTTLLDNFHSSVGERLLLFLTNDLLIVFLLYLLKQI